MRNLRSFGFGIKGLFCLTVLVMGAIMLGVPVAAQQPQLFVSQEKQGFTPPLYMEPPGSGSDGCSTPSDFPSDFFIYNDQFYNACVKHDTCYETLHLDLFVNQNKVLCDLAFNVDMLDTCAGWDFVACPAAANAYHLAVALSGTGLEAYNAGQAWARSHTISPNNSLFFPELPFIRDFNNILTVYQLQPAEAGTSAMLTPKRLSREISLRLGHFDLFRQLTDIDGDGRDEYCRFVGPVSAGVRASLECSFFNQNDMWFSKTETSQVFPGYDGRFRGMADVDGDGDAEYCVNIGDPPVNPDIACYYYDTSTSTFKRFIGNQRFFGGKTPTYSNGGSSAGYRYAFYDMADVNRDGKDDYCRRVGNPGDLGIACSYSTGSGLSGNAFDFLRLGVGYDRRIQTFADVNGDGSPDYCRIGGDPPDQYVMMCTLNMGKGIRKSGGVAENVVLSRIDPGERYYPQFFAELNGDGRDDFCRVVAVNENQENTSVNPHTLQCDFAGPDGKFGESGFVQIQGEFYVGTVYAGNFLNKRVAGKNTPQQILVQNIRPEQYSLPLPAPSPVQGGTSPSQPMRPADPVPDRPSQPSPNVEELDEAIEQDDLAEADGEEEGGESDEAGDD